MLEIVSPRIIAHSSYSEGDHCPLSLSEGPKVRTFFSVKGRRPVLYFTVSLSEGPHARTFLLSDSSKARTLFHCFTQ